MSTPSSAGSSRLGFTIEGSSIVFEADETIYPLDAVYGASYLFVDRCFVYLARVRDQVVCVRLTSREETGVSGLDSLAGEFANELLSQAARLKLSQSTSKIREYYTAAALRSATAAPSIDDLLAELEAEEMTGDPLDILEPWDDADAGTSKKAGE